MFPTVEEYLLLDVLTNNDNNVQKAADKLVKMGYVKRDTPSKYHFKIFIPRDNSMYVLVHFTIFQIYFRKVV